MKKYLYTILLSAALLGSTSGCINTSKYNESLDDEWIAIQKEKGETVPGNLQNP